VRSKLFSRIARATSAAAPANSGIETNIPRKTARMILNGTAAGPARLIAEIGFAIAVQHFAGQHIHILTPDAEDRRCNDGRPEWFHPAEALRQSRVLAPATASKPQKKSSRIPTASPSLTTMPDERPSMEAAARAAAHRAGSKTLA